MRECQSDSGPSLSLLDSARLLAATIAMWAVFGTIAFLQLYSDLVQGKHSFTLSRSLELGLGNAMLKAALGIPVLWALLRFHRRPRRLPLGVAIYTALMLLFTAAHIVIRPFLIPVYIIGADGRQYTYWQLLQSAFQSFTLDDVLAFALTVAAFHIWRFTREEQARKIREESLRAQLANAELNILKMQLQPHFLFNTLNAIYHLAPQNSRKAQQMIERLSRLLRLSLEHLSSDAVTLRRELEFLKAYIDIEVTRFEERLQIELDIDPDALDAAVPSMILQPLVENAVRHGVAKLPAGGKLTLAARKRDGRLVLSIVNDCPAPSDASRSPGVGLSNTHARLAQMYGSGFSVDVKRFHDRAECTVDVPFRTAAMDDAMLEHACSR
ncbi:MAG TPA: histidine kinase [Bryobacteraceae bacterium]|nr:histidine kinase [Bryobacteraceae bacterium]